MEHIHVISREIHWLFNDMKNGQNGSVVKKRGKVE